MSAKVTNCVTDPPIQLNGSVSFCERLVTKESKYFFIFFLKHFLIHIDLSPYIHTHANVLYIDKYNQECDKKKLTEEPWIN